MKFFFSISISLMMLFGRASLHAQNFSLEREYSKLLFKLSEDPDHFQDEVIYVKFTNLTDKTLNMRWVRTEHVLPREWQTAVCDNVRCYTPAVSENMFEAKPNESFDLIVHLYPNRAPGDSSVIDVELINMDDPTERQTSRFVFEVDRISSVAVGESPKSLYLYPNPSSTFFSLSDVEGIRRLELYSISGKLVKRFEPNLTNRYDISEFGMGSYFLKIRKDNGSIRTLSLNIM